MPLDSSSRQGRTAQRSTSEPWFRADTGQENHDDDTGNRARWRRPASASCKSLALLVVGLLPWPADWDTRPRRGRQRRSPELNRAEREGHAAGYYEGLIGGRRRLGPSRGDAVAYG